ncbi:FAD-binding oxidoreductase [Nitratireductor sp. ZSWI3]|uniref:NAD(P)/FAD-dependent oxidoreductase n=1 Tax=Nitratireductor sp. ZSWI3 TaxID=2966359 RepID=UPI00214FA32B|nr:FAD-dependent oxidoreductase [Nitratireductor sp. ZSWI3]MCR4265147.1 FAD-binding oxidoreductase [Nitratireductor sp. ZSWI3]
MQEATEVAIIGGGVIGLAIALQLATGGREVMVIEPNEPGSGASYGNAGTIADYAVIPVGTPAVLRNLPSLLFDRDSPLAIRRSALPALMPWLLRFAWQSQPAQAARNAAKLARLLSGASEAWRELAGEAGATDLMRQNGCLYLYASADAFHAAASEIALRKRHGIEQAFLTAAEVAALEPGLPAFEGGGVFFPDALHLSDPGEMMRRLANAAASAGVRFLRTKAEALVRTGAAVHLRIGTGEVWARTVVIAAGAHSKQLAAQAGDRVPLDTERGYHVEFDMEQPPVSRPVCPTARGFYLVPMQHRLRVAGTVELGGLTAPPDPRRIALLERGARELLPSLGSPARTWLGFRPSMPDSVPVIRPSRGGDNVILAFGHGHLGLTLAPATARIVADLVTGRTDPANLVAFSN